MLPYVFPVRGLNHTYPTSAIGQAGYANERGEGTCVASAIAGFDGRESL